MNDLSRGSPKSRSARRTNTVIWLGALAIVTGLYLWIRWATADIVWTTMIAETVSPDGAWKASVDEIVTEGLIATVIIANVHLISTSDPGDIVELLGVDKGSNDAARPRIAWTAPDRLHITVPGAAQYVTVYERKYRDVRVDVSFEPVDAMLPNGSRGGDSNPANGEASR